MSHELVMRSAIDSEEFFEEIRISRVEAPDRELPGWVLGTAICRRIATSSVTTPTICLSHYCNNRVKSSIYVLCMRLHLQNSFC